MFVAMYTILSSAVMQAQKAMEEERYEEAKTILQEGIDAAEDIIINFDAASDEEHRLCPYIFYDP